MPADFDWSQLADLSQAETFAVRETEMQGSGRRLEGSFYGSAGYRAVQSLEQSGFTLLPVSDCARVFNPPIFKRCFVNDEKYGVPYITGSVLMQARPEKDTFLSRTQSPELETLLIEDNMVLITDSGSIGNVVLATKEIDGWASTNNLIRVVSRKPDEFSQEFFYTVFQSELGQYLLTRNTYGSVIEHIDPSHVGNVEFPLLPCALRARLTELIQSASADRVAANALLDEAQELVYRQNYIEPSKSRVEDGPTIFEVSSDYVRKCGHNGEHLRLDATYYDPKASSVRRKVERCRKWQPLKNVVGNVILLGKTFVDGVFKVEEEFGVPYYTGKELMKNRPLPETFITCQKKAILERLTVKRGTTLITCAGTVGRVMYVRGSFEGASVTHDAIRVLPNGTAHPGYVYAFLSSPLGQIQLARCSYGSVIPRLYRTHVEQISIPIPTDNGAEIGAKVDEAFDLRAQALKSENDALALFGDALKRGRAYVEREWGADY